MTLRVTRRLGGYCRGNIPPVGSSRRNNLRKHRVPIAPSAQVGVCRMRAQLGPPTARASGRLLVCRLPAARSARKLTEDKTRQEMASLITSAIMKLVQGNSVVGPKGHLLVPLSPSPLYLLSPLYSLPHPLVPLGLLYKGTKGAHARRVPSSFPPSSHK